MADLPPASESVTSQDASLPTFSPLSCKSTLKMRSPMLLSLMGILHVSSVDSALSTQHLLSLLWLQERSGGLKPLQSMQSAPAPRMLQCVWPILKMAMNKLWACISVLSHGCGPPHCSTYSPNSGSYYLTDTLGSCLSFCTHLFLGSVVQLATTVIPQPHPPPAGPITILSGVSITCSMRYKSFLCFCY